MAVTIDPTKTGTSDEVNPTFASLTVSGPVTLSGGTANGVAYLNGSKVLTTGSALTYDGLKLTVGGSVQGTANFEIAQGSNTDSGVLFSSAADNAGNRNWVLDQNRNVFGDMVWRVSAAAGGNPFTSGSDVLSMTSAGIAVTGSISATDTISINNGTTAQYLAVRGARAVAFGGDSFTDGYVGTQSNHDFSIIRNGSIAAVYGASGYAVTGSISATAPSTITVSSASPALAVSNDNGFSLQCSGVAYLINGMTVNGTISTWANNGGLSIGFDGSGDIRLTTGFHAATPALAAQTATSTYAGSGAPSNGDGADGDFYFRSDGGALTTIYHKRTGAWAGVV